MLSKRQIVENLTMSDLNLIFESVRNGVNGHGHFLTSFAETFICADSENKLILLPTALVLIEKYNLYTDDYRPL